MKDILLVEDNSELAGLIQAFLVKDGWSVIHSESGEEALVLLQQERVRLVLLDIMMKGMDGFAVCRAVRGKTDIPVLIMSARVDKADKLNGFELGADDYMEKPIDIDILSAKVRALLERFYGRRNAEVLVSGGIRIDKAARQVYKNEELLELNVKEYDLLLLLASHPGKTLHKDYLFGKVWGADSFSESQTLTVHIKMLRAKVEDNPRIPKRIQTVWGVGYRYEEV